MDLLHLEAIREKINRQAELVGLAPLAKEFLELLDIAEKTVETGDTTELEEWAR